MDFAARPKNWIVAFALVGAALPAAAQPAPPTWDQIITPSDRARLEIGPDRLADDIAGAARAGEAYGVDPAAVLALVRAAARPIAERDLVGDWRCRSIQVHADLGIFAYPRFQCRVRPTPGGLFFEKLSGSQRMSGRLYRRDARSFVLLGGFTVNDETQRRYQSEPTGADLDHNRAGIVARVGGARMRILFPADVGGFEAYELTR